MKTRVSKKEMRNYYGTILSVGYCELQHLLKCESPAHYSAGVYGWACDWYEFGNVVICTGYSPIGQKVDYSLLKRYNEQAEQITKTSDSWAEVEVKLSELIKKFIEEATR